MIFEISRKQLVDLLIRQLNIHFVLDDDEIEKIESVVDDVFLQCEENFVNSPIKYYYREVDNVREAYFSPFHSGSWTIFLYYLCHRIYVEYGRITLADKIFYLNKIMNGVDIFYDVELPKHFTPSHQIGTVLGRARYGDRFYFLQNCTVGENKGHWPVIGDDCYMCAGSMIIGDSEIGDNVTLGAGCIVKNQKIPSDSICFGESPNLIIKPKAIVSKPENPDGPRL